jgi:monoamine oxidase
VAHILIAGAGLAGLAAAYDLQKQKHRVTVIEARTRVGGRVWTLRDGFVGRQHAEAGADLIESNQKALLALVHELNLPTVKIIRRGFGFYGADHRGRLRIQPMGREFRELMAALHPVINQYKLGEERWDTGIARAIARQPVSKWLMDVGATRQLRARMRGFRGFFLADPEDLSLLALVDFFGSGGFEEDTDTFRIRSGNDRLPDALARALRQPLRFGSVLRRVRQTADGIVATVEREGHHDELTADAVIIAIPAVLLRDVVLEPGLRDAQRDAIAHLKYGDATRLLLQFDRQFWRKPKRAGLFGSDQPFGALWDGNEQQKGPMGILSFLAGGGASQEIRALVRTEGLDGLVNRLRWLGTPGRVLASTQVVWEDEPWSRGGYAYFDPQFNPEWRAELSRPHGRVFFAGEHTHLRWQGYMEGAVLSGQRAAAEVVSVVNE